MGALWQRWPSCRATFRGKVRDCYVDTDPDARFHLSDLKVRRIRELGWMTEDIAAGEQVSVCFADGYGYRTISRSALLPPLEGQPKHMQPTDLWIAISRRQR